MAEKSIQLKDLLRIFKSNDLYLDDSLEDPEREVSYLSSDSREVSARNAVFFARKGLQVDGHDYVDGLEKENLSAVVIQDESKAPQFGHWILVRDTTEAMALAAKAFFGDPTAHSFSVAVTGTNGKTTSTFLLQSVLNQALGPTALMGTVETKFASKVWPSQLTTPDFSVIQKQFSEILNEGAKAFVFEASSHALDQKRLLGIDLDVAVFTNLTIDHLDYHKGIENYYQAKKKLFSEVLFQSKEKKQWAIIEDDGRFGSRLIEELRSLAGLQVLAWGKADSDRASKYSLSLLESHFSSEESRFKVSRNRKEHEFKIELVGHYNVSNAMAAVLLGFELGLSAAEIQAGFDQMSPVPGRLEKVGENVFVDYAHTPDALENVLLALRPLCKGKLKLVFGCGGDRDRTKRPLMGEVAELQSDEIFLTSDNPRTEDPREIILEVQKGFQALKPTTVEANRKKAIELAVKSLDPIDLLLIAGKGHETYQIIGKEKKPFDDREIARQFLSDRRQHAS